jgi:predicted transcriptional regulator
VPRTNWNPTVLTTARNNLLTVIEEKKPTSITELAKYLNRKRENVYSDLKILEHYGLVKLEKDGNNTVPSRTAYEIRLIG